MSPLPAVRRRIQVAPRVEVVVVDSGRVCLRTTWNGTTANFTLDHVQRLIAALSEAQREVQDIEYDRCAGLI